VGDREGSSPALDLAIKKNPQMLILINSNFKNLERLNINFDLVRSDNEFDFSRMKDMKTPLLLFHNRHNKTVAEQSSRILYDLAISLQID